MEMMFYDNDHCEHRTSRTDHGVWNVSPLGPLGDNKEQTSRVHIVITTNTFFSEGRQLVAK